MNDLLVHRCEDSKYNINWVVENNKMVMINRNYVELHEPTYSGISIVVQSPDDEKWFMEYGHNEEGFMSVSDHMMKGRAYEIVPIEQAIRELLDNTSRVLGL
jgi:hypothetical protein